MFKIIEKVEKENKKWNDPLYSIDFEYKGKKFRLITPYKISCYCGMELHKLEDGVEEFSELVAYGLKRIYKDLVALEPEEEIKSEEI